MRDKGGFELGLMGKSMPSDKCTGESDDRADQSTNAAESITVSNQHADSEVGIGIKATVA